MKQWVEVHSTAEKCTPVAQLVVPTIPMPPEDNHHTGDHLSSHTGKRTGSLAGTAFRHLPPPISGGQEVTGCARQGTAHQPSGVERSLPDA